MEEHFNYCIGRYWDETDKEICVYAYHSEVQYGTMKEAEEFFKYVISVDEEKNWKIFVLQEIGSVATATASKAVTGES